MDFELSLSHPELASFSGLGQSTPILESALPYSVWMEHPDGSTNFVSYIQPLRRSDISGMSTVQSDTGCKNTDSTTGPMLLLSSDPVRSACSPATHTSRLDVLWLIGFLICRLLIGIRFTRMLTTGDRPIRSWRVLNREISCLASLVHPTEVLQPGEPGELMSGLSSSN
jgi:hypothetical protein